jgi:probable HAF family extracellular repeat protein
MRITRMTSPVRSLVVMAAALLAAGMALIPSPARAAVPGGYRAIELNVVGWAADVNDARQLTGSFVNGDAKWHPFLWQRGRLTDLGALRIGSSEFGYARDINNRGQVVGESAVAWGAEDVTVHAFLWQRGVMTDLGTLGGADSWATAVNDQGQVFGTSSVAPGQYHAFRWERGVMTDLGAFRVSGANNRGQVVGTGGLVDDYGGVLWDQGRTVGLGFGQVSAINNAGWVVGSGYDDTVNRHAYLWRSGVITDLGTLGGGSTASDVNDRGVVLVNGDAGAALWRAGKLTDLTPYGVVGGWPGVEALNNRGDLAGGVLSGDGGDVHPVLYLR